MGKNKVSERFKKAVGLALVIASAFVYNSCGFWEDDRIQSDAEYYTGEELEEEFYNNEALFTEVAEIVLGSGEVTGLMMNSDRCRARITYNAQSKYFTEDEWSKITTFFEVVKPAEIERYGSQNYGFPVIEILFPQHLEPGQCFGQRTALYYIPSENDISISENIIYLYDTFKKIGGHWWMGEELDCDPCSTFKIDHSYYENGAWHNMYYYSEEQLTDIFLKNKDQFNHIAQMMLDNDIYFYQSDRDHNGTSFLTMYSNLDLFTDDEKEKIKQFFNDFKCCDVVRYKNVAIGFYFPMNAEGCTTALYYLAEKKEINLQASNHEQWKRIENGWWIVEDDLHDSMQD
jgi:hypothetical protein